jgi:hypothetical protein
VVTPPKSKKVNFSENISLVFFILLSQVLKPAIDRVVAFFSSKEAVSQSVALETAAALQMTLDEVSKNAQQQLNQALKDKPKFSLDLDIAAPKITIPTDFFPDGKNQCKLLVDLGYLTLQTEVCKNCLGVLSIPLTSLFPVGRQNKKRYICY